MGIKSIADAFDISRNTVRKYVRLYQQSWLSMENLLSMPSHKVQELLGPSAERAVIPSERRQQLEALLPEYAERLKQRGVMVKTLFEEYSSTHPDGYRHAQFEALLYRYRLKTKAVGHVEHYAGDQMYVDFAGDRLAIVEPETGEKRKVEVFVAILPCSHYTYCEAVWSQKKEDLIKASENAVKLLYRSVYVDIKDREFHSLEELNEAIRASLERFNERKLSGRNQSRRQLFESVERDFLRPLPAMRHQMRQRKSVTVMRNSYVTLNKHHYSVPTKYIGKRVELVYDADTVEIFHSLTLVTSHHRDDTPYTYTQKEAHNLPGHHGAYEKDLDELYSRAAQIDNILLLFLKNVATAAKYPPAAFRMCRGIMSLEKKYGLERLVAACACATQLRAYSYREVQQILQRGDDADYLPQAPDNADEARPVIPAHRNIRGAAYFAQNNNHKENNNGNK